MLQDHPRVFHLPRIWTPRWPRFNTKESLIPRWNCIHRFDVRIIQEKNAEIQALYAPYRQKAKIGKYEHREDRAKLASMLREFDDPSHPYLNSWGVSHGRKPFVPVRRSMFGKNCPASPLSVLQQVYVTNPSVPPFK